jgi:hypothetical protein
MRALDRTDAERADSFARLVAAIRGELAALDAEDAAAIEAATAAKAEALEAVQADVAAGAMDRPALEEARRLNAEAALRARAKMIGVERKLVAVSNAAAGIRPPGAAGLTYGRDGRWSGAGSAHAGAR